MVVVGSSRPLPLPSFHGLLTPLFVCNVTTIMTYVLIHTAVYLVYDTDVDQTALSVGAALSPTSLGFSAQLLGEAGEVTTPIGQLICTAAVIDDVLSLLLLAEVQALGDEDPKVRLQQ